MLTLQRYCQRKDMKLKERIKAFSDLGKTLNAWLELWGSEQESPLNEVVRQAHYHNGWFDEKQVILALHEIAFWLNEEKLENWVRLYAFPENISPKVVGVIMAGNIPLVGFHDYLSVLVSGHKILAKLSSKDKILIQFLNSELLSIEPRFQDSVDFSTERFTHVDAVVATGSDNSSRYFEYYFSKKPNIIRSNRTSVAVLTGKETKEELHSLGNDIFRYYGLGCRSITKVYLPEGFSIDWFYSGIIEHGQVINNHKYQNNYDYHKSLFLLNRDKLWDNNFILLKRDSALSSPVGTLFFEEYNDINVLEKELATKADKIQCRVGIGGVPLGKAQKPELTDYSDNIDILQFLLDL
ncbi:MAG: hypothetical protein ACI9GM_000164 [Salibacteraceae bacterium]|jgi:hypothetical protein